MRQSAVSLARWYASVGPEESIWLSPIEDLRKLDASREGMLESSSSGRYPHLVDDPVPLFRDRDAGSRPTCGGLRPAGQECRESAGWAENLRRARFFGQHLAARTSARGHRTRRGAPHHTRHRTHGAIKRPDASSVLGRLYVARPIHGAHGAPALPHLQRRDQPSIAQTIYGAKQPRLAPRPFDTMRLLAMQAHHGCVPSSPR